jgi:proteasome lid subunit RPN8/RPN11
MLDEIVEHAVRDAPNECCGLVVGTGGTATAARPRENLAASPFRFDIDGRDVIRFAFAEEDEDQLLAIYHSHTRSEPFPSQTDVNFAAGWPGVHWLIVGVSRDADPVVRNYLIEDGVIAEAALEVS